MPMATANRDTAGVDAHHQGGVAILGDSPHGPPDARAVENQVEGTEGEEAQGQRKHPHEGDADVAHHEVDVALRGLDHSGRGGEEKHRAVLEHHGEAEGEENAPLEAAPLERGKERLVEDIAQTHRDRRHYHHGGPVALTHFHGQEIGEHGA